MAFRYDKFALVLPRIYIVVLLVVYLVFLAYSVYASFSSTTTEVSQKVLNSTWEEYLANCGSKVIMVNSVKANIFYENYYKNNIVAWTGYYILNVETDDSRQFFGKGKYQNFLVKMQPTESEHYPDIILSIPNKIYKANENELKGLVEGSKIWFKGVLKKIGDEAHLHLIEAIQVQKVGNEQNNFPELRKINIGGIIHMING
eukprot:TRINITY_DN9557_c0_g2_i6.p1 TRINITY_DN9557_c0_g2~~TRINITY_DN9557_c0_g2_i6.p1  ORF type:complete len:202 (-),score=67.21 TRINITY_DN9557_c0_g2_i6:108-713(-)